jgi:GTP cyclohydrolase II
LPNNNPEKITAVRESGIEIVERMSADVPANAYSADYLAIKRDHLS